ncbi:MAG: PilX N-terminal domain-containing pilus assembly protein [Nitrospirota bacterium]
MVKGNERGIALIMALVLLTLLTLLGAWVLDRASTDLKIAGNYKNAEAAFSMADTAVAYASNPANLTAACEYISACTNSTGSNTVWPPSPSPTIIISGNTATVSVRYLNKGPLPVGSIYDADLDSNGKPKFSGVYFMVTANGTGPHNATAQIETNVVQVVSN